MDTGLRAPIIPDKHTRGPRSLSLRDPREMVNIAVASRHKARTSTANFYFDRRAINMPLRLVRRQITIYRWLLPRLVPSLATYLFQYFLSRLLRSRVFSEDVSLSLLFDSAAWHAAVSSFQKNIRYIIPLFIAFYVYRLCSIVYPNGILSHVPSFAFIIAFRGILV